MNYLNVRELRLLTAVSFLCLKEVFNEKGIWVWKNKNQMEEE